MPKTSLISDISVTKFNNNLNKVHIYWSNCAHQQNGFINIFVLMEKYVYLMGLIPIDFLGQLWTEDVSI